MQQTYDRAAEDIGNSIHLEHVNVNIPDQRLAMLFYAAGLGLTRDPYLQVSDNNMWINVGRSQFHLPTGKAQVLRGHTGLVIEGRAALLDRLAAVRPKLDGTRFSFSERNDHVEATCPWGNRVRCYEPDEARFGRIVMEGRKVVSFEEKPQVEGGLINGGFFVLDPSVLKLVSGDQTVWEKEPMEQLAAKGELAAWVHHGFWQPMDTLRDMMTLNALWDTQKAPWKSWP